MLTDGPRKGLLAILIGISMAHTGVYDALTTPGQRAVEADVVLVKEPLRSCRLKRREEERCKQ